MFTSLLMDNGYNGGCANQRKVVKGHGMKGRQHEAKLEALEDPTIIANVGWQNLPQPWL
jgi:hypothetical protein